jgi:DNA polymerase III subunit gamma/tau
MTTYTVLARRYRSQDFAELIGQEGIVKTLQNAILTHRVAHAYLFTGTRGVGKTSTARLFAKALNGGTPEVDHAIMTGQDTDVIEIDGASNNKVEEARELIANCIYRPLRGKRKVYIIDEVHMLTIQAFNALLKTMEEPPEHVVFILCTTEAHKVPATIQSRCQRFDFRPIPAVKIADHLRGVLKKEGLDAEPELLHAVARLGGGSMRDSLSLLDRVIAGGQKKLTLAQLNELLGLPDRELIGNLIDACAGGDAKASLEAGDALLRHGLGIDQSIEALAERLRDLMVLASCGPETDLVELSKESRAQEVERARRFDAAGLVHMIALCESVQRSARNSAAPRVLFDALLVRVAMSEKLADVTALVARLNGANGSPGPSPSPATTAPGYAKKA